MLEVDVKSFLTCRLCLEEPGVYPIIPSIKEEIKYCFDIDIEPFDGLPQLICKKCKLTLSEYYALKGTFIKKQQQLREKCANQLVDVTKKSDGTNITGATRSVAEPETLETRPAAAGRQHNPKQVNDLLKKDFQEHFVCKICSKSYLKLAFMKKHLSNSHKKILKKQKKIFKNSCSVLLNKIDDKENCTGQLNVVVYNSEKIITNRRNSLFHSFYLRKDARHESGSVEKQKRPLKKPGVLLDSSDDEICSGKKRKTRRLFSCSSAQTTVLEETKADGDASPQMMESAAPNDLNDAKGVLDTECINIDDTSSEAPSKDKLESQNSMTLQQKQQKKVKIANYKAIQNIVTMCHKKYIKKIQAETAKLNNQKFSESSLKHKVLSLGRKVIHKQGFGCTGLLRYMEHKDLEILWQPTSHAIQNRGSNFVRIMPKLKTRECLENYDLGWKELYEISFCKDPTQNDVVIGSNTKNNTNETPVVDTVNEDNLPPHENEIPTDVLGTDSALNDSIIKNKLLNKSPVANPKQLPKKTNVSETKPVTLQENYVDTEVSYHTHDSAQSKSAEGENIEMRMPIITSTISLPSANIKDASDIVIDKPAPRIKVKPASELMSKTAFNNQSMSEDIWAFNKSHIGLPYHLTSAAVYGVAAVSSQAEHPPTHASEAEVSGASTSADAQQAVQTHHRTARDQQHLEYVTLHTLELPNTKTKSPFQYFKTVLLYHGLFLLDLNEDLPATFNCLVRFKLLLKQDTKRPLGVVLSLFCSENNFCFTFKDSNLRKFDPNQLPAFWQWELLKIYKTDVVDKILENAAKIGKHISDYTKNFLCLLKSIDCITES